MPRPKKRGMGGKFRRGARGRSLTDEEKDFLVMATRFGEEEIREWFRYNPTHFNSKLAPYLWL